MIMVRIRRVLRFLLVFATVLYMVPQGPLALNVSSPALGTTSTKYFTAIPGVYEMGDGYAVI